MTTSVVLLFILAFLAFSLSALCGGEAGLILIPVLNQFLPISYVPASLSIGTASSSISRIVVFYKNIRWDIVKLFIPASIPAVWLGSWLLQYLNPLYLQLIMGLFLVSNLSELFKKKKEITKTKSKIFLYTIGFLVGFVSGITGAVGLLFNKFYLRYGLSKEEILATRATNEIVLHIIKLILYTFFGLMTKQVIIFGLVIALAAVLSSWIIKWIIKMISFRLFQNIGYMAMVLSGISLLTTSVKDIVLEENLRINLIPISNGYESKIRWAKTGFSFEFNYSEGFEFERVIQLKDIPENKQQFVKDRIIDCDDYLLEEVFGFRKHYYELYLIYENGRIEKFKFK